MNQDGLGYGMHLLEELLASLAADGATVGQFDEYRRRWVAASAADDAAQAPCPLCFRGGRTAQLRPIAARGPYDGAACLTCGNEFYWKAQG